MFYARIIMERDPFKELAPRDEDRKFRALFGCPAKIVLIVWSKLVANDLVPECTSCYGHFCSTKHMQNGKR
jgi:hypothetical protein